MKIMYETILNYQKITGAYYSLVITVRESGLLGNPITKVVRCSHN